MPSTLHPQTFPPLTATPQEEVAVLLKHLNSSPAKALEVNSAPKALFLSRLNTTCMDRLSQLRREGYVSREKYLEASEAYILSETIIMEDLMAEDKLDLQYAGTDSKHKQPF